MSGYDWIVQNLRPTDSDTRDVIMYSSHLGASLASSVALSESRSSQKFPVRGLIAYNGIYNWTMFLPDHKVNKSPKRKTTKKMEEIFSGADSPPSLGTLFDTIRDQMPGLFHKPSNLFDDFASPALFFQTAGLHVPESFTRSHELATAINELASKSDPGYNPMVVDISKPPRRMPITFPSPHSGQRIPESLLLYSQPPYPQRTTKKASRRRATKPKGHHFHVQAVEFVELLRRNVAKLELEQRQQTLQEGLDLDPDTFVEERVQLVDVGQETGLQPNTTGVQVISRWLEERVSQLSLYR